MTFDMKEYANDLVNVMAKAQTLSVPLTPATHGYDIARMAPDERTGYCKAMLDCRDWLTRQAATEQNAIVAAGLRVAAAELGVYRNEKLNAGPQ